MRRVVSVRSGAGAIKIPARLTRTEWAEFEERARRDGRSLTGQVSWLIRRHLAEGLPARGGPPAGTVVEPALQVRDAAEEADDDMGDYWRSRSPAERIAGADGLRRLAYSLGSGRDRLPGIVFTGRLVRPGRGAPGAPRR